MQVDVTLLGYFMALVSVYYVALFTLSLRVLARRDPESVRRPPVVIFVPAVGSSQWTTRLRAHAGLARLRRASGDGLQATGYDRISSVL